MSCSCTKIHAALNRCLTLLCLQLPGQSCRLQRGIWKWSRVARSWVTHGPPNEKTGCSTNGQCCAPFGSVMLQPCGESCNDVELCVPRQPCLLPWKVTICVPQLFANSGKVWLTARRSPHWFAAKSLDDLQLHQIPGRVEALFDPA